MQKFFSLKHIKIFVPLLVVFFLAGTAMFITRAYSSSKAEALIAEAESASNAKDGDTSSQIVSVLSDLLSGLLEEKTGTDSQKEEKEEVVYSAETMTYLSRVKSTLVFGIIFYVLCAVFAGFAITCGAYDTYLHSDKYKAKMRRLETAEKRRSTMKHG